MRLVYIVTVDTDEAWVERHKEYTPEFIRRQTENRLSDALRYELAYDNVTVEEKPEPVMQFEIDPNCKACRNGDGFHDHVLVEKQP